MSLLAYAIVGVAAVICACFVHEHIETKMRRAKFVFCALTAVGTGPIGYVLIWVWANQHPDYSLKPMLLLGVTLWVAALVYSVAFVLCQRDIAPSK